MKMKKTFKFLTLTVLLSMVGVLSAFARKVTDVSFVKDGLTYKVLSIDWGINESKTSTGTLSVTNNNGDRSVTSITIKSGFKETISETFDGAGEGVFRNDEVTFTVTTVEADAFKGLNKVTSLTIPGTVTTINQGAFANLTGLTSLKIGTKAEPSDLESIGDFAFGNCPIETLDLSDCPKLNLKQGQPLINAFGRENHTLKTVLLPKEVKEIGTAFKGLSALENLDLSKTKVSSLDDDALAGTAIKKVELARPQESTTAVVSIGAGALPETIEELIIRGDLAANAITAQPGLTNLKRVCLFGALQGANAVPTNAFPNSPIETLAIGGREKDANTEGFGVLAAGAIAEGAFMNQNHLTKVSFNGPIVAGGIGTQAFAGAGNCAEITFRGELKGAAAIGKEAFKDASIKTLTFKKDIAKQGIAEKAFENISRSASSCDAEVLFQGNLGEQAVGARAFLTADLANVTFEKDINFAAIRGTSFQEADMEALTFQGSLKAGAAIGGGAFQGATIKSITFEKNIEADGAIQLNAFKDAKSVDAAGTPVLFKGYIAGKNAIAKSAFENASVSTVTIEGYVAGQNAIGERAFYGNTPLTSVVIKGEIYNKVSDASTIATEAFAGNANLALIDLQNNLWSDGGNAIAAKAFAGAGTNTAGAVLNAGLRIKTAAAIQAGAFSGAKLAEVNFFDLMVEEAIADFQFAAVGDTYEPAKIATVNFKNELKDWSKEQGATKNFVGRNAFSNTKVNTVNFVKVSTPDAIVVDEDGSQNPEEGPFADNGAEMTINFNGDVCTGGFGKYAFANSNTRNIVLKNECKFEKLAFAATSFQNIALGEDGRVGNTKIVTITYDDPKALLPAHSTLLTSILPIPMPWISSS